MSKETSFNIVQNVVFALQYAQKKKVWVVIVCPDETIARECRQILAGAVPEGTICSGRTAILPGGGRVSLTPVDSDVFVPEEDVFHTLFVGWSVDQKRDKDMSKWYKDTAGVLRVCPL